MKKILFLICFLTPLSVFAHQPNYVDKQLLINDNEPAISKAYYGELAGSEVVYTIDEPSSFKLYLQILSPKIDDAKKDFEVLLVDNNKNQITKLATSSENWQDWYEEYAGDWYWRGPSFNENIPAGKYKIIVKNPNNTGKYALAIGEIESFPIDEFPTMVKELYLVKTKFFNEPWHGIFNGVVGKYLLVIAVLASIVALFAILLAIVIIVALFTFLLWILVKLIKIIFHLFKDIKQP